MKTLLSSLLQKYEKSKSFQTGTLSLQRPQISFQKEKNSITKSYYDEMDYMAREWIHHAIEQLKVNDVIEVKWVKYKENEEVDRVYLNTLQLDEAYKIAQRTPKLDKIEELRQILLPLSDHPWSWVQQFWSHYEQVLSKNQTSGLDLDDASGYSDLVKLLQFLPLMDEAMMKRMLSHRLFQDTKYIEKNLQKRLLNIYKRFSNLELDSDLDYLASLGIEENPIYTLVSGPITLVSDNQPISLTNLAGGVGLSSQAIQAIRIQSIDTNTILFIENLSSYHQLITGKVPAHLVKHFSNAAEEKPLVIYTGGYPHHALRKLLLKMATYMKDTGRHLNIRHWGDIDYGGILIFEHLKRNYFPNIRPLLMDESTFLTYSQFGMAFSNEYATKLERLLVDPSYLEWHGVIQRMLEKNRRIEQESLVMEIVVVE